MNMPQSRYRPNFQSLESRRLLAGDVAALADVSAIIAADVNADGMVTASDALQIINELNAAENVETAIAPVREAVDVDADGTLTALDALRVINRLNTGNVVLVDSVMRLIPTENDAGEGTGVASNLRLRESVSGLLDQLNSLRSQVRLPREAISDVVGEIIGLVRDASLTTSDRNVAITDRIENIVALVGLDADDVRQVGDRVRSVIDALPDTLADRLAERFDAVDEDVLAAAERIVKSLDDGFSLSSIRGIVAHLRDLDLNIRLPSLLSVLDFVDVYRQTTADRAFNDGELTQLRESAGIVLSSAGVSGELRDDLLAGFDRVIRLRF